MEKLIANLATSKVSQRTLQGRNYLVAPVSMILEGVWPGSQGAIFYDGADIARSVPAWNHKPITIGHPELSDGTKVSGTTPESLEKYAVGMVLNTKYNRKTKKLQAEAWFEISRLQQVEGAEVVHSALLANQKLEVSTGLFVDALVGNGSFDGKEYAAKAANYRPDHLAIILQGEGACSLKDGAGLLVNKSEKASGDVDKSRPEPMPELIGNAKQEHVALLSDALPEASIEQLSTKDVVFAMVVNNETTYFKQNYEINSGLVKLIGKATPVTRKVTYSVQNQKNEKMERQELIKLLGQDQADFVTNMSEESFKAVEKLVKPAPAPQPEKVVCNSVADLLAFASEGVKNQVNDAIELAVKTREALIDKIVANAKDSFTKEELASFSTAHLNKLAAVVVSPSQTQTANPVYAGEAFVGNQAKPKTAETVVIPPSTFAKSN